MSTPTYPVSTIAKLFNLTERRVQQLASEGVIPKPERGKYDLVASVRGYIAYLQDRAFGKEVVHVDAHQERARLLKAQADKTELEFKTMQSQVIAADQVELLWSGLVSAFRARMLALPTRCAHSVLTLKNLPGKTYQEIEMCLRSHVYEALHELARYDPEQSIIDLTESRDLSGTPAEPDGEPLGGHAPPAEQ